MNMNATMRTRLLICTALAPAFFMPTLAAAQDASAKSNDSLEEIVVTAQKREQSVQDVPIAVTALTGDTLQANRVSTVTDLTGLAPGVTVRPAAGGSQIPSFTVRGAVSYGVVPGSDKQVSIYLDGVYISSPRGSIFDLPDVERIEMLRGPQGTLFGRNSTAGAVSISTRDPSGEMHVKAKATVGNYDQFRFGLSVDTPQIGPFSAYFSYVHNYKRGDYRNLNAGQVWDRTSAPDGLGVGRSPDYLGTRDGASYFAAVKFQPSDNFKMVYKFDKNVEDGTPDAAVAINYDANYAPAGIGAMLDGIIKGQTIPVTIVPNAQRPDTANNGFAVNSKQRVTGHSLTTTWRASDSLTIKNIMAYRSTYMFTATSIDGIGGLPLTPAAFDAYALFAAKQSPSYQFAPAAVLAGTKAALTSAGYPGSPFGAIVTAPLSSGKQWSDELQINYDSKLLTLTAGAMYFHSKDAQGVSGHINTPQFSVFSGGVIGLGQTAVTYNYAKSYAAYGQAEIHASSQLDIVLGARITKDDKSGVLNVGKVVGPVTTVDAVLNQLLKIPFTYSKTKPNWLIGLNYKPNDDILVYAKFSTAFVSGGAVAGVPFEPETAASWEAGIKADLFDKHLRTSLSVYTVTYKNFQTAQGGTNFVSYLDGVGAAAHIPGLNDGSANQVLLSKVIGTFILPQGGPVKNSGFEFEATAMPVRGLTLGGSLGYSKTTYTDVNPILLASNGLNAAGQQEYPPTLRPDWTATLSASYESAPIAGDMRFNVRMDGTWHSKELVLSGATGANPLYAAAVYVPASWVVNARMGLKDIAFGDVKGELAVWSRNLFNNRDMTYALGLGPIVAGNFQAARTIGADLTIQF